MPVAIVVDPSYPVLEQLAHEMPVWAIECPLHRATATRIWPSFRDSGNLTGLTLYDVMDEKNTEANCLNIIDNVDLHHGVLSSGSKIDVLKVIGTALTDEIKTELENYDFVVFEPTEDGFIARSARIE